MKIVVEKRNILVRYSERIIQQATMTQMAVVQRCSEHWCYSHTTNSCRKPTNSRYSKSKVMMDDDQGARKLTR